jgi:predicted neutral ceramidase superfamily lipid hydrolase
MFVLLDLPLIIIYYNSIYTFFSLHNTLCISFFILWLYILFTYGCIISYFFETVDYLFLNRNIKINIDQFFFYKWNKINYANIYL